MVGAFFRGGVFYRLLSRTHSFGVLAAAARGGMVWEKPRGARVISLYYAVFCIDSILHPLDAINHWM